MFFCTSFEVLSERLKSETERAFLFLAFDFGLVFNVDHITLLLLP